VSQERGEIGTRGGETQNRVYGQKDRRGYYLRGGISSKQVISVQAAKKTRVLAGRRDGVVCTGPHREAVSRTKSEGRGPRIEEKLEALGT